MCHFGKTLGLVVILLGSTVEGTFLDDLSVQTTYQYLNWEEDYHAMSLEIRTPDTIIDNSFTEEDIQLQNENYDFFNLNHMFGAGLSYRPYRGLSFNVGAGLIVNNLKIYEVHINDYEEEIDTSLDYALHTSCPGFYADAGFSFHLPVYKKLYLATSPQLYYGIISNLHPTDPDHDEIIPEDYSTYQNILSWQTDITAGIDLDWFAPWLGVRYQGARIQLDFDETENAGESNEVYLDRRMIFKPSFPFSGIAGFSIKLFGNTRLGLEASLGKGYSISTRLQAGL